MNDQESKVEQVVEMLRLLTNELIFHPEALRFEKIPMPGFYVINVHPHLEDLGRVIGQRGNHFVSLRDLAALAGHKLGIRIKLGRVETPELKHKATQRDHLIDPTGIWPRDRIFQLFEMTARLIFPDSPIEVVAQAAAADPKSTAFDVRISQREDSTRVTLAQNALSILFTAIGRRYGHFIYANVTASLKPDHQPESADGRWAKVQ